jgi:NH3-dependent NAD+ synthetase
MKSEVFLLAAHLKVPESILNSHQMDYMENEKQTKTN